MKSISGHWRVALAMLAIVIGGGLYTGTHNPVRIGSLSEEYQQRLLNGVCAQVPMASETGQVDDFVTNLCNFLGYRSNCVVSASNRTTLEQIEVSTLNTAGNRLTREQVKQVIEGTWFHRVSQLTDAQLEQMANSSFYIAIDFKDCQTPDIVDLRSNGEGTTRGDFFLRAKQYRDDSTPEASLWRYQTSQRISGYVDELLDGLNEVSDDWATASNYSPIQVFLVTYSAITNDWLSDDAVYLQNKMQELHDYWTGQGCLTKSSPQGRKPFGDNGYLYAVPLSAIFNESTQALLLQRVDALN